MRILVTGGGGFVGQNLVNRLLEEGHQVTITSSGTENVPKVHKVLYATLEGIDWQCVYDQDIVVHLMANNDTLCNDREEMMRANMYGPIKLFYTAFAGGCRKFVYASSTAVYGNSPAPYTEDTQIQPLNVYGESKAEFDKFALKFAKESTVSVMGFRFCNVYGPGEEHKGKRMSMIGQMLRKTINKQPIVLFKDGEQRRDWVHVYDVVDGLMKAINDSSTGAEIFNLGSGISYTFNEVSQTIQDEYAKHFNEPHLSEIQYIDCPFVETYQSHTECNIEKARRKLGYSPGFDLRSGVRQYLKYLLT